jgi:pre-rRNA-processing protein IPI3
VGFEDGSVQLVDLYKSFSQHAQDTVGPEVGAEENGLLPTNPLYREDLQKIPATPSLKDCWSSPGDSLGAILSMAVVYEGNYLLTGHSSGKVVAWDVAKGRVWKEITSLSGAVSNLLMLPPAGFSAPASGSDVQGERQIKRVKLGSVQRPRFDFGAELAVDGKVPGGYTLTVQLTESMRQSKTQSALSASLDHTSFPPEVLEEALSSFRSQPKGGAVADVAVENPVARNSSDGYMSLVEGTEGETEADTLRRENAELKDLLQDLRKVQAETWQVLGKWGLERADRTVVVPVVANGETANGNEDEDEDEDEDMEDASENSEDAEDEGAEDDAEDSAEASDSDPGSS